MTGSSDAESLLGRLSRRGFVAASLAGAMTASAARATPAPEAPVDWHGTSYRTVDVQGVKVFYREAGRPGAPLLLLLHGFPSSSRMFEPLLQRLADRYHLIAPDFPGFGYSDAPPREQFAYTFDHIAEVIEGFVQALSLSRYTLYLQDYGGPVGYRLAVAHPERVQGLIVQNAVAHEAGLGEATWAPRRAFWADRAAHEAAFRAAFLSPQTTRNRHLGSSPHPERYDPDQWEAEIAFLAQPGQADIQADLFYDYRTNVAAYPAWQAWLRRDKPRSLLVWGRYDPSFAVAECDAFMADVPEAEVHVLDAGHFALDEAADQIAGLMRIFLG
jgi:pimeloyl-ACP methyl ester carboxylesterase